MSVIRIEPLWDGRGGTDEGIDATRATRTYLITTDNRWDTEQTIRASGVLPARYTPLAENIFLTLRSISLEQRSETPYAWVATLEYSSEPVDQNEEEREREPNPLARRRRLRWQTNQYRQAVVEDRDGNAVVNSAGDFPDPPPEKDASYWTATISKNVAIVPDWLVDYDNPVNSEDFPLGGLTVLAGKARLQAIQIGDEQIENGVTYVVLSYTLEIRKKGWRGSFVDNGLREKDPSDPSKRIHILDDDEEPVTSPVLLDGTGRRLADPSHENAEFISWDDYDELDFNDLPGIGE